MPLLAIQDLSLEFRTRGGTVQALENVGLSVEPSEIVGVVGESGVRKVRDRLCHHGDSRSRCARDGRAHKLSTATTSWRASERKLRHIRGREISMVFQNPRGALNPIRTVGRQIGDVLLRHGEVARAASAPPGR